MALEISKIRSTVLLGISMFALGFMAGCAGLGQPEPVVDANGNVITDADGQVVFPRTVFDRLEFEDDEWGCVDIRGQVDVNPSPLASSNATMILKKTKNGPNGEVPEC